MFVTTIDESVLQSEYRLLLLKFAELTIGKKETLDYFTKLNIETLEDYAQSIIVNNEKVTAFYMGMAYAMYMAEARERGVQEAIYNKK